MVIISIFTEYNVYWVPCYHFSLRCSRSKKMVILFRNKKVERMCASYTKRYIRLQLKNSSTFICNMETILSRITTRLFVCEIPYGSICSSQSVLFALHIMKVIVYHSVHKAIKTTYYWNFTKRYWFQMRGAETREKL